MLLQFKLVVDLTEEKEIEFNFRDTAIRGKTIKGNVLAEYLETSIGAPADEDAMEVNGFELDTDEVYEDVVNITLKLRHFEVKLELPSRLKSEFIRQLCTQIGHRYPADLEPILESPVFETFVAPEDADDLEDAQTNLSNFFTEQFDGEMVASFQKKRRVKQDPSFPFYPRPLPPALTPLNVIKSLRAEEARQILSLAKSEPEIPRPQVADNPLVAANAELEAYKKAKEGIADLDADDSALDWLDGGGASGGAGLVPDLFDTIVANVRSIGDFLP